MQNTNLFIRILKGYGHLPEEIESKVRTILKKGSYLIKEGQTNLNLFIIEEGLIRSFYKKSEQEITIWFAYENVLFVHIASFYDNKALHEVIQYLEDMVFQYILEKTYLNCIGNILR